MHGWHVSGLAGIVRRVYQMNQRKAEAATSGFAGFMRGKCFDLFFGQKEKRRSKYHIDHVGMREPRFSGLRC